LNLIEGLEPFRERARAIRRKVRAGHDPRSEAGPDGLTLRQARALHVQAMRNDKRSQRSMEDIEYFSDRFLSDWLDLPLRKLTRDMLEERHSLIGRRAYKPSKRDKARGGRVSANKTMRYLRALVNEARARDATLPGFPTKFPWYDEQPKDAAIPLEQLPTWFREVAAMRNELKRDYYLLGVLTGVRRDSLSSIRCADLDLAARTLHIPCPKGGPSRAYTVSLSDDAMAVVERRLRATNNWLFPRADSKSGHIEEPRPEPGDGFTVPFTIHGLRHTYISASHDAEGVNLYHAMQLANHKVPKSDAHGGYSRRNVEALRPHQQRITDYFKALGLTV
jgi:integrase